MKNHREKRQYLITLETVTTDEFMVEVFEGYLTMIFDGIKKHHKNIKASFREVE